MSEATIQQNLEEIDEPLVKLPHGKRFIFMAVLYCLFMLDFVIRIGFNAILPLIKEDLNLTATQVGLLGSAVFLGMAIFVMPISFIGENKSQRRTISFCAILWSVASIICGMAGSAVNLIINRLLVGAGNSAYAPLSTAMVTSWYKKSSWGKVLGVYNTSMTVGMALGAIVFAAVAEQFGWRMSLYIIGGFSLVISLISFVLPDNKKLMAAGNTAEADSSAKSAQKKLKATDAAKLLFGNKALLTMCLAAGICAATLNVTNTFLSIYYVEVMGMSVTAAASLFALQTPLTLIASPLGGAILDKWYQKDRRARMWMPMLCILLGGIVYAMGYAFCSVPLLLCAMGCYSLGTTSFHTASQELVPSWYKSLSYSTYVLFIQLLGATGPTFGGIIVDMFGVQHALVYVQGLLVLTALLLFYASTIYIKYYNLARRAEEEQGV